MGTATSQARAASNPGPTTVDMKLEAIVIPVADVDRSKRFYEGLGWRLDADFPIDETLHVVQMTSPGSACSIHFGKGVTTATPGSAQGMLLAVADIDAARADLIAHGADVSETFHTPASRDHLCPGRTPSGARTARGPRSASPTATAGDCRRSRRGCLDEDSAGTWRH